MRHNKYPVITLAAMMFGLSLSATAQEWPTKAIRLVVPYAAGGVSERIFRAMSAGIEKRLGKRFFIENKPGADGSIGGSEVARAAPDGYTFLLAPTANFSVIQHMHKNLTYHPIDSFDPVGLLVEAPLILTVVSSLPVRTMKEFLDLIRSAPGKYNYGSPGSGSPAHLTMAQISQQTGNSMVYVPFKGTAPLAMSMLAGDVHATTYSLTAVAVHLKSGKLRALAITSQKRMAEIPDVPTTAEAGYPQYSGTNWWVIAAPRGTNAKIINRLWSEFQTELQNPDVQKRIATTGHVPVPKGPADTLAYLKSESARYKKIVEDGNITAR